MARKINDFVLKMGKLSIPLAGYKLEDSTKSIPAKEVVKVEGKIYPVKKKQYIIKEDGTHQDIDSSQILKSYEKDDGEIAIFTKQEQTELFKKGSSKEWASNMIVSKSIFTETSFQKEGIIAMVNLDKKKELMNKKHLKYYAMLKSGLGQDKAIIFQVLYKNIEYPIAITNYKDKLLIRFLHYSDEIRQIESGYEQELLPQEERQARAFIMQFNQPDFKIEGFKNNTEEKVREIIEMRGIIPQEAEVEIAIDEENPFETEEMMILEE